MRRHRWVLSVCSSRNSCCSRKCSRCSARSRCVCSATGCCSPFSPRIWCAVPSARRRPPAGRIELNSSVLLLCAARRWRSRLRSCACSATACCSPRTTWARCSSASRSRCSTGTCCAGAATARSLHLSSPYASQFELLHTALRTARNLFLFLILISSCSSSRCSLPPSFSSRWLLVLRAPLKTCAHSSSSLFSSVARTAYNANGVRVHMPPNLSTGARSRHPAEQTERAFRHVRHAALHVQRRVRLHVRRGTSRAWTVFTLRMRTACERARRRRGDWRARFCCPLRVSSRSCSPLSSRCMRALWAAAPLARRLRSLLMLVRLVRQRSARNRPRVARSPHRSAPLRSLWRLPPLANERELRRSRSRSQNRSRHWPHTNLSLSLPTYVHCASTAACLTRASGFLPLCRECTTCCSWARTRWWQCWLCAWSSSGRRSSASWAATQPPGRYSNEC